MSPQNTYLTAQYKMDIIDIRCDIGNSMRAEFPSSHLTNSACLMSTSLVLLAVAFASLCDVYAGGVAG